MVSMLEVEPSATGATFLKDVIAGLSAPSKSLPCKYFYDARGSALFDDICELPEYYPTRTELGIMHRYGAEICQAIGRDAMLIEYGSGSSVKTKILLDNADDLAAYVPIDISHDHLLATAAKLRQSYPHVEILPLSADYTRSMRLPQSSRTARRKVVYFPGSTIGNFHPGEALDFLASMARICGEGGGLVIGVDLHKGLDILEPAYNDRAGVTEAFNRNLLNRVNCELRGAFDLAHFAHLAYYNQRHNRIEMHLVSDREQEVWIGNYMFQFAAGESIWTESSYKYTINRFAALASAAGWKPAKVWTDPNGWFSVQYLTVA